MRNLSPAHCKCETVTNDSECKAVYWSHENALIFLNSSFWVHQPVTV